MSIRLGAIPCSELQTAGHIPHSFVSDGVQGFVRFDPSACRFPSPHVPVLPPAHWRDLSRPAHGWSTLGLPDTQWRSFMRARYALHQALAWCGLDAGASLLAPAYHCRTMLDPAIALGAEIHLYPLDPALHPSLEALEERRARARRPVKAVLLPHYFGFPQPRTLVESIARWCEEQGITLIEDCSHVCMPVMRRLGHWVGTLGRYGIASNCKFFAAPDGALLWSPHERLPAVPTRHAGLRRQLGALRRVALELCRSGPRLPAIESPDHTPARCEGPATPDERIEPGVKTSPFYDPALEGRVATGVSRYLEAHTNLDALTAARRENFRRWLDAMPDLVGARPLFATLADGVAPYMFPLLLEQAPQHFHRLKQRGLPIWRWDDEAISSYSTAQTYRLSLLHLPCHQALTHRQMDWMLHTLCKVLRHDATR